MGRRTKALRQKKGQYERAGAWLLGAGVIRGKGAVGNERGEVRAILMEHT